MIDINIPLAFVAGIVSFFAPCVVSLLPAYVAYVVGVTFSDLEKYGYESYKKKIVVNSFFYVLGFSLIFVLLGILSAGVGVFFRRYDFWIQRISGLIVIFLGLYYSGFLKLPFFQGTTIVVPRWREKLSWLRAFVVGIIFATIWTPCIGAVLGSILAIAATTGSILKGSLLLFFYSLGISAPFILATSLVFTNIKSFTFLGKKTVFISKIAGILLVVLGALLLSDTYKYLNFYISQLFSRK